MTTPRHPEHPHLDGTCWVDHPPIAQVPHEVSAAAADPVMRARMQAYYEARMARHERMAAIGDLAVQVRRYERIVTALQRVCPECAHVQSCCPTCPDHEPVLQEYYRLQAALEGACDRG